MAQFSRRQNAKNPVLRSLLYGNARYASYFAEFDTSIICRVTCTLLAISIAVSPGICF